MSKIVRAVIPIVFSAIGFALGGPLGAAIGSLVGTAAASLIIPPSKGKARAASGTSLQIGEVPRQVIVGRAATPGSLVDAFNYGGKYGTDWEVLVIALADHRCDALEGFYVNDAYVPFVGDGMVAGYQNQLAVYWREGTETQTVPSILTANGPGWTASDNGAGVAHVVVAYKADASDAKNPVWTNGRPKFLFVVRGARCYDSRKDSTAGGVGSHRWLNPATWEWTENVIVARYAFARGFFACDRVTQPEQLVVGRGLSAVEAPPENVFARANLCDELVDGEKRYRVGGAILANETFIEVENDFAAACAGTISQPEGAVEIDPGEARAAVVTITDKDLVVGSKVKRRWFLGEGDRNWVNTVVPSYIEPAHKWSPHAAPVRRDVADVIADRGSREETVSLGFVTWITQAGRIGEIVRRLGRLQLRSELMLPPRFCELEEGDWIIWQSDRYLDGAAYTFRVDGWTSDKAWHHSLQLRQISASCYSDTVPLDSGSVAVSQPAPVEIGAPSAADWSLAAGYLEGVGMLSPALILTGSNSNPAARFIQIDYCQGEEAPTALTIWNDVGFGAADIRRREIPVAAGGIYRVGVAFVVDGVVGDRLILGPVTALPLAYPDGTPVDQVMPATWYQPTAPSANDTLPLQRWVDTDGNQREYLRGPDLLTIGGVTYTFGGGVVTIPWFEVGDHTADNTAENFPVMDYSPPRTINCDDAGAPFTGQFPDRSSIRVFRNGASIKASDSTDFVIRTANNLTNAVVDNATGSLNKGDWTVDGMTANSGLLEIEVRVDGNLIGIASIPFSKSYPVQVVTGGAGVKSASLGPNATVSGTADTAITPVVKLAVASGEAINIGASLDYTIDGSSAETRTATLTPQYSSDGATGWTALASGVVGSTARAGGSVFNSQISEYDWVEPQAGHADITQNKTGLAAQDWFVRVVAKLDAAGRSAAFTGPINWSVS